MANRPRLTAAMASLAANQVTANLDGGYLRLYGGRQPMSPDRPINGQELLAELRFGDPAFDPAEDGVATAHPLEPETRARADGRATWFRAVSRDGVTPVVDGTVGTEDADLVMNTNYIVAGAEVNIAAFTYVQSKT